MLFSFVFTGDSDQGQGIQMTRLLDDDGDDGTAGGDSIQNSFRINKKFAEKYAVKKKKEELSQRKRAS